MNECIYWILNQGMRGLIYLVEKSGIFDEEPEKNSVASGLEDGQNSRAKTPSA